MWKFKIKLDIERLILSIIIVILSIKFWRESDWWLVSLMVIAYCLLKSGEK